MALSLIFSSSDFFEDFAQVDLHFAPSAIFTHVSKKKSFIPMHKDGFLYSQPGISTQEYQYGMIEQMMSEFKINKNSQVLIIKHDFELECQPANEQIISLIKNELMEITEYNGLLLSSKVFQGFKKSLQPRWQK